MTPMRAALYVRVSTLDQEPENQLLELRRYCAARGWTATSTSTTASRAKDRRPALDELVAAAKRRTCKPSCAGGSIDSAGTFATW